MDEANSVTLTLIHHNIAFKEVFRLIDHLVLKIKNSTQKDVSL